MEKVDIKMKSFPSKPLPLEIKRYHYRVLNSTPLPLPQKEAVDGYVRLDGFEFSPTSPDVIVLVYLDKYDQTLTTAAVKGMNETKYAYVIKSSLNVRLSLLTGDSRFEFYQTSTLLKPKATQYHYQSSTTYATEAAATEAGNKDESMLAAAKRECMNSTFFGIQQYLKYTHGYPTDEITIPVWSMKAKSFDYSEMDQAQTKAMDGLKSYSANGLNDENRKLFQEAIAIWEKVLLEFNPDDKKSKINVKNVGALYANLALTHNWLINDNEATRYLTMLSESRGSSWSDMIGEIVNDGIKGRQQDLKRKSNALVIEKIKSPYYVSPDFVVNKHAHRISAIQKSNSFSKKLPDERRYFEYLDNGLLSRTYTENYNPSTKGWEKRRDVHTIKYDHDLNIMYVYGEKSSTVPLYTRKFKNGKLVSQMSQRSANDSSVVKFYYNAAGQLERYVCDPHLKTPKAEVKYSYANDKLIRKEVLTEEGGQLKIDFKEEYVWSGNKLTTKTRFTLDKATGKYPEKGMGERYEYDAKGFLAVLGSGYETQTFGADDHGNIIECHTRSDDGSSNHKTYVWEPLSGNAIQYTTEVSSYIGPEKYPAFY
ncbi:hypothetical protein DQQ10_20435 [Pseudochryseolinea flava]|uniref:Uncharacterized protein n=2 Tax=Pseudochryseolinea flava TaxID=2059302 RepID=A0A364XYC4_9BACT|nr:hypothetical protein DQQ10_20435 [Pseudochryseolinea flava]